MGLRFGNTIPFPFNLALGCYIRDGKWAFHTYGMRFRCCRIGRWDRWSVTVAVICGMCRPPLWQVFYAGCVDKFDRSCFCSGRGWYLCGTEILCTAVGFSLRASFLCVLADLCFETSESLGERSEKCHGFVRYLLYIWLCPSRSVEGSCI